MAPPVYSLAIFAGGSLTPGSHVVTVPAGLLYVVRDVDVVLLTAPPADMDVSGSHNQAFFYFNTANAQTPAPNYQWRGRQILGPGETLTITVFHGTFDVSISGYQLTLP